MNQMKNIQNYMKNYMMINNGCSMIDKYCGLVEEIKNLSTQLQRGEFRHIMREPNNLALLSMELIWSVIGVFLKTCLSDLIDSGWDFLPIPISKK